MKKLPVLIAVLLFAARLSTGEPVSGQAQIQSLNGSVWKLQKQTQALQQNDDKLSRALQDSIHALNQKLRQFNLRHDSLQGRFVSTALIDSLAGNLALQTAEVRKSLRTYCVLLILFVLLASIVTFYVLQRIMQQQMEIQPLNEFQVFFNKIKNALNRQSREAAANPTAPVADSQMATQVIDHELPTRVAEEVFRMRMRLSRMPQETKGLTALLNAVNRLEDELNIKGYTLLDLSGQAYFDEMTVAVKEFIPQDDLPAGKKKILRMLKPQVKYLDTIISYGEAEVAMSSEDLSQT